MSADPTWWVLRPLPRRVRLVLWLLGAATFASWAAFSCWPTTKKLLFEDSPELGARELGVYLLGFVAFAFFGLVAGGVWVFLKIQGEFAKLREEDSK